jgi:PAS domain S-box-containing protein
MIQTPAIASSAVNAILSPEEEIIRIPGFIKPYGVLIALEEPQLEIVQISSNTQELLGIPLKQLLNQPLAKLLGAPQTSELKKSLGGDFSRINPLRISIKQSGKTLFFDGIIHRYDGVAMLELLPTKSEAPSTFFNFYHLVKTATDHIQEATTTAELSEIAVQEFRNLTEFDRVMVYKFDAEGAGTVVAEAKCEALKDSYLGLYYPATDIPGEARRLFFLNKVRVIPDVNYQPVAIVPAYHPKTDRPLDLSLSNLRGVSPSHIEYLQNMGVVGSLVIALTKRKALWGLISCHHYSPKPVSYELQTACEFLGQVMSLELVSQEENDDLDYKVKLNTAQSRLLESIAIAHTLRDGLMQSCSQLLDLVGAQGCAICINGDITVRGETPSQEDLQGLVQWLEREAKDHLFSTDCLCNSYPAAEQFKDVASGLLVLTLSKVQKSYLLWFRPEVIQTVSWAGNPDDSYQVDETGVRKLCPRQSFESWKETVRFKSQPWLTVELEAAREFGKGSLKIANDALESRVQERTEELSQAINQLQQEMRDRKQAVEKIREQAALIDISPDAIFVRDLDCRVLFWNKGAEEMYGWISDEILGRDSCKLLIKPQSSQLDHPRRTVLTLGEWKGELTKVTKSGKEIIVSSRWILMRNEAGEPKSILTVDIDITEQKQLEQQILRTQRLESLGTLASGIAHDLNNILTPIMGTAQLLPLTLPPLDEQNQNLLKLLSDSASRGSNLVKQILFFAKGTEGNRITLQISHLLREIRQLISQTFPKSIDIQIYIPEGLWMITGDATQLHQVLMNLCVNARDAMPNGGVLSLSTENLWIDEQYARMELEANVGPYLVITIADTGIGIPKNILDRIFDPFFTTKEPSKGTGLGLSTVIGIVKSYGGFVKISSTLGEGTQFQVFFPATETTSITSQEDPKFPAGSGESILIVDDETPILAISKETLQIYNYRVLTASNGFDAIAQYAQHQNEISAVLMDMMMPEMGGEGAIRTLQLLNPQIKIIASSGIASNQGLAEAAGAKAFLAKPFTADNLLNTLKRVLAEE